MADLGHFKAYVRFRWAATITGPNDEQYTAIPCPFCGGTSLRISECEDYWVNCPDCDTDGPLSPYVEEAVEKWNTRHVECVQETKQ